MHVSRQVPWFSDSKEMNGVMEEEEVVIRSFRTWFFAQERTWQ
jgi:hypothetical protein